ncbi:MAG: NADPH-dependent 7-cyano-7-deazaguanine reductase QueF [Rickettsiales bacterium]|nr:NADPH-dependent 7-cyano-7-deazaguanine reductase QueF [Rickettsiales bacterium]
MKNIKKTKYLGKESTYQKSPEQFKLDVVSNPNPKDEYCIRFSAPEFTSICPITSQPDFGIIIIDYVPSKFIVESKSLKLFLFSFRNYGAFHEDCTMKIVKKIEQAVKPKWIRISSFWNPRGGIPIDVFFQSSSPPKGIYIKPVDIQLYTGR